LPFDNRAATAYGALRVSLEAQGTPIGALDASLAAQAVGYRLIFVTNNIWEFARVPGLTVEDRTTP
jgi:tRNA(fMet)-specific endonuclease VapC